VPLAIADRFINGENVDDWSGFSTSSAGDINGDGLDDLIVGAYQALAIAERSIAVLSFLPKMT
jgi:hypothetical protein